MTREEHIYQLKQYLQGKSISMCPASSLYWREHWEEVIKALEQEPTTKNDLGVEYVSRKEVEKLVFRFLQKGTDENIAFYEHFLDLPSVTPQEPKTGHCKDCNWWKDSDGEYRRGCGAESQCPINRREVFEGNGYCYMFEPQKSEDKE